MSACISGGNFRLVIGDSLIDYLFPNLKRKYCYEWTLADGVVIGGMSTMGYAYAISVTHQRQYGGNTNRIYAEEIP
ncbi:hypothetical protein FD723_28685 [Nostoc sp. C052]|uniref:hypothetical protein n=1 Tax=Nostoc sp. C052 TaxID=2576902 RepID=UPI0015C2D492|nr:hypothetical protein [Nostoc sp. C052]QLE44023.1 hypothetical protein FD723_28685 [Nostoc sp. C052]